MHIDATLGGILLLVINLHFGAMVRGQTIAKNV